jgi:hypothetical protein
MSEADRGRLVEESEALEVEFVGLREASPSFATLVEEQVGKLREKRQSLESPTAPPAVEKQLEAATKIIEELLAITKEDRSSVRKRALRMIEGLKKKEQGTKAENVLLKRRIRVTEAVADEAVKRLEVGRFVERTLAKKENSSIQHLRGALLRCGSVKEAKRMIERVISSVARRKAPVPRRPVRMVEKRPVAGIRPSNIGGARKVPARPLSGQSVLMERAGSLTKRLGLPR